MRIVDIIDKKKNGLELTKEEITYFINEYTCGNIPDYQASALIMAMFINGMSDSETSDLTFAMAFSGQVLDLSDIDGIKVDKHSTGGVGDKVSLIISPIVAEFGIPVAKMSGRGLGFSGGTIDKLESIDGFRTSMTTDEFKNQIKKHGIVIAGQTGDLAPADKKIYALRDVTATVDSIPLIASSVMSKKIASGADAIVLDVKVGSGAFMKTLTEAEKLANATLDIGKKLGKKVICIISGMDEPLGNGVGNIIEVREVLDILKGNGPEDLMEVSLTIASAMIYLGGKSSSMEEAREKILYKIKDGSVYNRFIQWISSQGGDISIFDDIENYKLASKIDVFKADRDGYIDSMNTEEIGKICVVLGAGRETKDSVIDPSVGLVFDKKVSDYVKAGDAICYIHHNNFKDIDSIQRKLREIIKISDQCRTKNELIYKIKK